MIKQKARLCNKLGLHARAAAKFVNTAAEYDCRVILAHKGMEADGKSIMEVMMLAASCGDVVEINTAGADQEKALRALTSLIKEKFGEPD